MRHSTLIVLFACVIAAGCAHSPEDASAAAPESITPKPRMVEYPWMSLERWYQMHAEDVGIAAREPVELLFIGDSITEGWPTHLLEKHFGRYQPANFGIGGDQTDNLLWRLRHGASGTLEPKVVSLLIGVNNFGLRGDNVNEVYRGIEAVVTELRHHFPEAEIIVHGIFPHRESGEDPERDKVKAVNRQLEALATGQVRVHYLDIGEQLVMTNGDLSPEVMPDFLHLSEVGYEIWASELLPVVETLMGH
ncbi:GDSL-type esterase/lipase family protein [Marinimicrobium alkaliphilum]|uniref:GDSL-type esterase/lipase family protein n=1 Tax=Marinimicrobium alkaliphilum TaxID=2202654 RepID=UPI000DBA72C0|nr:GDSL-type esterase/lipase family protein [Marinimicrobium alkaliphilum]